MPPTLLLAIIFLLLGFIFIVAEIFFPSFGMLSLGAAGCIIASIVFAFVTSEIHGIVFTVVVILVVPLLLIAGFRIFPKTPIGKKFIHTKEPLDHSEMMVTKREMKELEGKIGVTTTILRPAGVAEIEGGRVDVVAEGEMIDKDIKVRVVKVDGNRVVVEKMEGNNDIRKE